MLISAVIVHEVFEGFRFNTATYHTPVCRAGVEALVIDIDSLAPEPFETKFALSLSSPTLPPETLAKALR